MKNLKKYKEFINESVRDFLKPKSVEEILKSLGELSPNEMLIKSVKNNFVEGVKIALERGADPSDHNDQKAFRLASAYGYIDIVKYLLKDERVDPSIWSNNAIILASQNGHVEVVELLLNDPRVDPSDKNNLAIRLASQNGHVEIVKLLLQDPRVDPSADNNSAIIHASDFGHIEIVKLLLQNSKVRRKLTRKKIIKYENQIKGL